ncbi:hypothetical protein [Nocardioides sp.]|uniref:hypothetical protein n=1 Tax=Nocardioides sp. TaxID=35761 RepID=UPI002624245B|nr:hypothetical protein [Nocardioides sp.]
MRQRRMTGRRTTRTAALLAAAAIALSSCSLPDQIDGQQEVVDAAPAIDLSWFEGSDAADIVDAALLAMAEIGSVRLHQDARTAASGDQPAQVVSKDLLLAAGDGIGDAVDGDCTGVLQLPSWGEPADLVVQDDLGAFRGGEDFWLSIGAVDPAVRDQLAATYADEWTTTPGLASLCAFTDFLSPVMSLVGDEDLAKAGLGDVAGVPAGRVQSVRKNSVITAWVQIAEPHLVLEISVERSGDGGDDGEDGDGATRTVTTFGDPDTAVDVDFPAPEDILAFEVPSPAL